MAGGTDSFKSWLDGRTQDPHLPPPCPRPTHPSPPLPPPWTSTLLREFLWVPHSGPLHESGQGILPTPYLPLPILFDTPNDSAQNFCREGRVGSGYWILWPQCAPKPSGPWGWASIFTPVYFSHQSCEVTPSVTPNLQTGKQVQRGQVTSLSTLSPKWLNAWGLSSHSIYALDERITEKPELTYRSTSLQSLALSLAICNLEFSWWER